MKTAKKFLPFILVLLVWHVSAELGLFNRNLLPGPASVLSAFVRLARSGHIFVHAASSIKRVTAGFIIASFLGIMLGTLSGYSRRLSDMLKPLFEFLRPIPPIAWIPLAILWFGLGDKPAIFIVFVGSFFPIFIYSYWGVRSTRMAYIDIAKNFGSGRLLVFTDIILPGSLPSLMRGLKIGLALAWTSVISAELVGAQSGLGYMIQLNRIMLKTDNIIAGMISIGLIGLGMIYLMRILERKLTFWNRGRLETADALPKKRSKN